MTLDAVMVACRSVLPPSADAQLGPDSDLFAAGLTSLQALALQERLASDCSVTLPPGAVYTHRTPRALLGALVSASSSTADGGGGGAGSGSRTAALVQQLRDALPASAHQQLAELVAELSLGAVTPTGYMNGGPRAPTAGAAAAASTQSASIDLHDEDPVVLLFPGQGSLRPNMLPPTGSPLADSVTRLLSDASAAAGMDLEAALRAGGQRLAALSADPLAHQLTVYALSVAALQAFRSNHPGLAGRVVAMAGLSVGELAAATAAGALPYSPHGVRLLEARAKMMRSVQYTCPDHGMMVVSGLSAEDVVTAIAALEGESTATGSVPHIALHLAPDMVTVAGPVVKLDALAAAVKAKASTVRTGRLHTSGVSHSPLLQPVMRPWSDAIDAAPLVDAASSQLVRGLDGVAVHTAADIATGLRQQLVKPVQWTDVMDTIVARWPRAHLVELGPGESLTKIVKRLQRGSGKPDSVHSRWQGVSCVAAGVEGKLPAARPQASKED